MSHTCKRHCGFYTATNKSLFPVYTSTLCHTQTSNKHASSLWSTDTPGPDYCQITIKLQAFHSSAAHSHSDCSSCFLNQRERERKPVPVPAQRHDKHTCSQRRTHTSISWWVTLFIGRPLHKERMQGLKITVIIPMESAAHPCLVGLQRFTWPLRVKLSWAAVTCSSVWPLAEGTVLEMWKTMVWNGMLLFGRRGWAKEWR